MVAPPSAWNGGGDRLLRWPLRAPTDEKLAKCSPNMVTAVSCVASCFTYTGFPCTDEVNIALELVGIFAAPMLISVVPVATTHRCNLHVNPVARFFSAGTPSPEEGEGSKGGLILRCRASAFILGALRRSSSSPRHRWRWRMPSGSSSWCSMGVSRAGRPWRRIGLAVLLGRSFNDVPLARDWFDEW
jgi:hypothetical protein